MSWIPSEIHHMNREAARLLAVQLLAALDEPEAGPSVAELFDTYMRNHGDRCRTAPKIRYLFRTYLAGIANRPAASIKPTEVLDLHRRFGRELGLAMANRILEVLRATYNKTIRWGVYSGCNPCSGVSAFPLESRDRYLSTKDEITRFFKALSTMRSATFRNFVKTCLFTAARVSNVQEMRWQDIDFDSKVWRIPRTKSGKPVLTPLIPEAVTAIESQRGKHPTWVFPGHGRTGHLVNPARAWHRLCIRAGIENLRMHDLRRSMGSWQANTGASLQVIQKTLGHTSTRATHIYARLQLDPVRQAMEVAAKAMLS